MLPSAEKAGLIPATGRRDRLPLPGMSAKLDEGWYALEGVYGNKYRWIGRHASATLKPSGNGPQKLRVRGHAPDHPFREAKPVVIQARANGEPIGEWTLDRHGLFVVEADLPDASEYRIEIVASPEWKGENDERPLTVTLSMLRLVPQDDNVIS